MFEWRESFSLVSVSLSYLSPFWWFYPKYKYIFLNVSFNGQIITNLNKIEMESNIGLKGRVFNLGTKGKQLQTFSLKIVRALASWNVSNLKKFSNML